MNVILTLTLTNVVKKTSALISLVDICVPAVMDSNSKMMRELAQVTILSKLSLAYTVFYTYSLTLCIKTLPYLDFYSEYFCVSRF